MVFSTQPFSLTGLRKHILKKQRLQQAQQKNHVGEFSAMTSQAGKPTTMTSKLHNPPNLTSHIGELQKMSAKFQLPIIMTPQKQQSSTMSQQKSMTSQQKSMTSQQSSMTSQQSSNADERPGSMHRDENFSEHEEN